MPNPSFTLSLVITLLLSFCSMGIAGEKGSGGSETRSGPAGHKDPTYLLGPGDQVQIWVLGMEELFDKPFRVDPQGFADLPLIGRLGVSGMSVEQFREIVVERLRSEIKEPQITANIFEYRSQPISVLGAVNTPGIHQLQGSKSLVEVLSLAGGLRADAGYSVTVTRQIEYGRIPAPSAHDDSTGKFSIAEMKVAAFMGGQHPEQNIAIRPHDVVTVPRAELVYVVGEVTKAGGFVLNEKERMSALQALSLAGGVTQMAAPKYARVLRSQPGTGDRQEIPVNLRKLLAGKAADIPLKADDILFVPDSRAKRAAAKFLDTGINLVTGVIIWRR